MRHKYSDKETWMFNCLGVNQFTLDNVNPVSLYKLVCEQAFIKNMQGPAAYSLRRTAKAMEAGKPYRLTPEFDALISTEDKEEL